MSSEIWQAVRVPVIITDGGFERILSMLKGAKPPPPETTPMLMRRVPATGHTVPQVPLSPHLKRHLDRFSRFRIAHARDQQAQALQPDRPRYNGNNRPHLMLRTAARSNTQGEMTSRNLWARYDRHFVGITWHNVWSWWAKICHVIQTKFNQLV